MLHACVSRRSRWEHAPAHQIINRIQVAHHTTGEAHLLEVLVERNVCELDRPRRGAGDVPALDVAVPRSGFLGLVDPDVHGNGHVHLALREHPEGRLHRLHRVALLEDRGDRLVVEEARPRHGREGTAGGLFDAAAAADCAAGAAAAELAAGGRSRSSGFSGVGPEG